MEEALSRPGEELMIPKHTEKKGGVWSRAQGERMDLGRRLCRTSGEEQLKIAKTRAICWRGGPGLMGNYKQATGLRVG